ncbi:transferase [Aureococcus anophagefferens]|nr:transferase [Aureococcus anophagefferens]
MMASSRRPTPPFVLERFFAAHEFSCKHALCSSDTEAVSLADTVARMSGDTRALWESLSLGYTETRGHPRMLELLAEDYDGLAPANFQELAPQEAILLTFAALLEPGDAVVATAPGYQSFFTCAEAAGGVVAEWRPRFDGGAARFDVADLERLCAAHRPTCVAVNFPHNPTGALPSEEEWARVVDVCDAQGAYLFADEIYRGLGRTLPAAAAAYGRGISLGGLSKSLGMPGVRAGWLAAEDDALLARASCARVRRRPRVRFAARTRPSQDYTTICSSAPSQILAIAALEDKAALLRRSNAFVDAGRAAVSGVLDAHADKLGGARAPPPGPSAGSGWSGSAARTPTPQSDDGLLLPSTVFDAGDAHVRAGFGRADSPALMAKWRATLDDADHPATALLRVTL